MLDPKIIAITNPPIFKTSHLPSEFRENWIIVSTLRSDACAAHARDYANTKAGFLNPAKNGAQWTRAFDVAASEWAERNPLPKMWAGAWPRSAGIYLGSDAIESARRMMSRG